MCILTKDYIEPRLYLTHFDITLNNIISSNFEKRDDIYQGGKYYLKTKNQN